MSELFLKEITINDEVAVTEFLKDSVLSSGAIKGFRYEDGLCFIDLINKLTEYKSIPFTDYNQKNHPSNQYLLIRADDNKTVGAVEIRPFLTKTLDKEYEGNIGYSILSSERGKGYATQALKLAIEKFKTINLKDDIVICCYKENIGSRKVIEKFGGKLIEEIKGVLTAQKYLIKRR